MYHIQKEAFKVITAALEKKYAKQKYSLKGKEEYCFTFRCDEHSSRFIERRTNISHWLQIASPYYRNVKPQPFGRKVLVLGCDFRQNLPVVPPGNKTDVIGTSIKSFQLCNQLMNMRSRGQVKFNKRLLNIENGNLPNNYDPRNGNYEIPPVFLQRRIIGYMEYQLMRMTWRDC